MIGKDMDNTKCGVFWDTV